MRRFRSLKPSVPRWLKNWLHSASSGGVGGAEDWGCVLLLEADWDVWVVQDACGSRTERNRDAAYDRLAAAGCELVTTEMVGFEWLRDCQHPQFKAWQGLIK